MPRLRSVLACFVLIGVATVSAPVPASAAGAPRIASLAFTFDGKPALGHEIIVSVNNAGPQPPSGVQAEGITFQALDAEGESLGTIELRGAGLVSTRDVIGPWTASGKWLAESAYITDTAGTTTTYARDGSVSVSSGDAPPPPIALSALDFTLDNPQQDVAAPVVTSVAPLWSTRRAGDPFGVVVRMRDDRSQPDFAYLAYAGPNGEPNQLSAATPGLDFRQQPGRGVGTAGVASGLIPRSAAPGVWHATFLWIGDGAGNQLQYARGQEPQAVPRGAHPFTSPPAIDWDSLDLTVLAPEGPPDADPHLLSISLDRSSTVQTGSFVRLTPHFDEASKVSRVDVRYTDAQGAELQVTGFCQRLGSVGAIVPSGLASGALTLQSVALGDGVRTTTYNRDGTTLEPDGSTGHHGVDLSQLDLSLVAGQTRETFPANWTSCVDQVKVALTAVSEALPGSTVVVKGTVTKDASPVTGAPLVLYRTDLGHGARALAFLTTDSRGQFQQALSLDAPTAVRAQLLGYPSPGPTMTSSHPIRWLRRLSVAGPSHVHQTATVSASVSPVEAHARLLLERWTGNYWYTVTYRDTDSRGRVTFTFPAGPGLRTYRVQSQLTDRWAISTSTLFQQRRVS